MKTKKQKILAKIFEKVYNFNYFFQEKERQRIKDEKIRKMAMEQKKKMQVKNNERLRL